MKCRSVYGLSVLALMLSFCLPDPIDVRGSMAIAQPASKPSKNGSTLQVQGDQKGEIPNIPPAGPDLGWSLVGTAVAVDPSESFAIMEYHSTGQQGAFQEGDRLGEMLIKKILPDGVVIDAGNGEELLSMGAGGRGRGPSPSQKVALLKRDEIDSRYRTYTQFRRDMPVRLHFEGGQPGGLLIDNIRPDSIFSQIGLQVGDVIVGVNGRSITVIRQTFLLYQALRAGGLISLQIKRGENIQDLHFEIQ